MSANTGQVSLSPPRVAINPNRLYPVEPAIREVARFAINVMPASTRREVTRLMRIRRREPHKADALGWALQTDELDIPFLPWAQRAVFCELESTHETGDHRLMIARVLATRDLGASGEEPLRFAALLDGAAPFGRTGHVVRRVIGASGTLDIVRRVYSRLRRVPTPNLPRTTYELGGHTEEELAPALVHGVLDDGLLLRPPAAPALVRRRLGICVVGVGIWGAYYSGLVRRAAPGARLFVCGREEGRVVRVARATGADGYFVGLDRALADPRVAALVLVLPHDQHRPALERIAVEGRHVMVEKPIATSLADADAMIDAACRAGIIFMVAEDMHFRPAVREAARRIALGDVGEPLYLLAHAGGLLRPRGWKADAARAGGGVLMDIGVHYVRALRLLMGEPTAVIASRAMQADTHAGVEDSVQLILSSRLGWESHLLLSWATTRGHAPDIVVAGDRGTLHLWPGARHVDLYPHAPRPLSTVLSYVRPMWLQSKLTRPGTQRIRTWLPDDAGTGYLGELRAFLGAVAGERPPADSPADARRDLEIVLHGYEALREGRRVEIASPRRKDGHSVAVAEPKR
jgi:predicted dehydrogenase